MGNNGSFFFLSKRSTIQVISSFVFIETRPLGSFRILFNGFYYVEKNRRQSEVRLLSHLKEKK